MMDAAKEEYLAMTSRFPNTVGLMCWFHLKKNVKDKDRAGNKVSKSGQVYNMIMGDLIA